MHVIPDKGESLMLNENSENSSEFMYHEKDADIDTSLYGRLLNALKNIDKSYNPTMQRMHHPVIESNYKGKGDTRVIMIVEHEDDEILWACSTSIFTEYGEPETLKEEMRRPNGN